MKLIETGNRLVVVWNRGWKEWGLTVNEHEGSFWCDRIVLKLDCGDEFTAW